MKIKDSEQTVVVANDSQADREAFSDALGGVFEKFLHLSPAAVLDQLLTNIAALCIAYNINIDSVAESLLAIHKRRLAKDKS
jgi:hypothetical protein